jgi:hypothetical protein
MHYAKFLIINLQCYRSSLKIISTFHLLCFHYTTHTQFAVSEKQLVHVRASMGVADAKHDLTSLPPHSHTTPTPRLPEFSSSNSNTSQEHFLIRYMCIHRDCMCAVGTAVHVTVDAMYSQCLIVQPESLTCTCCSVNCYHCSNVHSR